MFSVFGGKISIHYNRRVFVMYSPSNALVTNVPIYYVDRFGLITFVFFFFFFFFVFFLLVCVCVCVCVCVYFVVVVLFLGECVRMASLSL